MWGNWKRCALDVQHTHELFGVRRVTAVEVLWVHALDLEVERREILLLMSELIAAKVY